MSIPQKELNQLMQSATREQLNKKIPKGLSKDEALYYKIKSDFPWYSEKFLKIRDKNSKLVPFKLNDAQIIMERIDQYCYENNIMRRYIVLKARQMGFSTYTEGKLFHKTANTEFQNSLIIAHEDRATQNLFNMSKLYYEELPELIRPMKRYSNEKALSFENPSNDDNEKQKNPGLRSKITVHTANTVEAGRSATVHNLHASEVAFFPDARTTMLGLLQCVPDTIETMVVLESTANGVGGYFYDIWQQATKGENDFIPLFFPWFTDSTYSRPFRSEAEKISFIEEVEALHTSHDGKKHRSYESELREKFDLTYEQLNWRKWCIKNKCGGDEDSFRQEYPSTPEEAFIATGRPRFNIPSLRQYQAVTRIPELRGYLREDETGQIKFEEDANGYVLIWEKPKRGKSYAIGADVAEGLADGDYSVATVGSEDFDLVASWYGHIDPDLFGKELVKLAKWYNEAYLGIEHNNHGLTTIKSVMREEYWNLYYQKSYDKITDKLTQKVGWTTSMRTKPMMIDKLAEFIRERYLGIKWDTLISECFTYIIEDNGSTNAQTGCHDDTVMSTAIMLQLLLEGKGELFTPEQPFDERKETKTLDGDEVVDKLFETDGSVEYSE